MDFDYVMNELGSASPFELYRLKLAIDASLQSEEVVNYFKDRLYPGQIITYLCSRENRLIRSRILKLNRTRLLVEHLEGKERWNIPYYFVNIDEMDIPKRASSGRGGICKSQLQKGDKVGFIGRNNQEVYGMVIRLNQKTATVQVIEDGSRWRVPYAILIPVLDADPVYEALDH
ncbi:hypothetical protein [Desulfonatronospira sp.]|uniref:hypothetical protein n=1 Tax=Desulfonatronospira sp. TaxID=1962951 RepID=UPI0025BAD67D|nr:hypothetical protein [Desulfonatronospira sp.]